MEQQEVEARILKRFAETENMKVIFKMTDEKQKLIMGTWKHRDMEVFTKIRVGYLDALENLQESCMDLIFPLTVTDPSDFAYASLMFGLMDKCHDEIKLVTEAILVLEKNSESSEENIEVTEEL